MGSSLHSGFSSSMLDSTIRLSRATSILLMSLVLSASSSCSPSAFLFLSLSILAFAVGDPAGSCCASCSLSFLHVVQVRVVCEFLMLMLCLVSAVLRLVQTTALSQCPSCEVVLH